MSINAFNRLIFSSLYSGIHHPGLVIENFLFPSVILKTELVASKDVLANNHYPSSQRFLGGENKNIFLCLFGLNSNVP